MRLLKHVFSSVVLTAGLSLPAMSADVASAPPVITADSVIPDDGASGWYLRGDIGFAYNTKPSLDWSGVSESNRRNAGAAVGGLGFGYRFNESFRSDLTLDFMSAHKLSGYYDATTQDRLMQQSVSLLANGYYDFFKYSGFTPYIGAGIGISQISSDTISRDINGLTTYTFGKSVRYGFTAAAMTGIAIDIGRGVQADIGYRLAWVDRTRSGTEKTGTLAGPINVGDYLSHQFRIGIRYLIN